MRHGREPIITLARGTPAVRRPNERRRSTSPRRRDDGEEEKTLEARASAPALTARQDNSSLTAESTCYHPLQSVHTVGRRLSERPHGPPLVGSMGSDASKRGRVGLLATRRGIRCWEVDIEACED